MHTTQSYAVFPFSVFSREHWFIIWTTFSIKAAKQSQQRRVWKEIDQLIASEVWIFHKKREPEPEDKGHPNKWSAAMRTPQTQGKMGRRMSSYGYRENRELDSTQNVLEVLLRHSPTTAVKWDGDTQSTQSTTGVRNVLQSSLFPRPSLHTGPNHHSLSLWGVTQTSENLSATWGTLKLLYYYHGCRSDWEGSSNCSVTP